MARKYVPNGRPHGGKREGTGRPKGATSPLGYGETKAVKAAGLRVPPDATKEQRELADECLGTMAEIMRGKVYFQEAPARLKAATALREEICGPLKQKVEHSFSEMTDEQLEARFNALVAKAQDSGGAGQTAKAAGSPKGDDAALGPNGENT